MPSLRAHSSPVQPLSERSTSVARVLAIVTLAAIGCATGCTKRDSTSSRIEAGTLRVQVSGEPVSLNPALTEDLYGYEILANTMDGLVGYDGAGKLENRLAISYELSADGSSYRFKLRPGIRWSDGRPVEASHIVEGFRRAASLR